MLCGEVLLQGEDSVAEQRESVVRLVGVFFMVCLHCVAPLPFFEEDGPRPLAIRTTDSVTSPSEEACFLSSWRGGICGTTGLGFSGCALGLDLVVDGDVFSLGASAKRGVC